ncbi:major facilitator superfamily domain-containing protein [Xylariales sp. PMI_506]|nr:major facilitator superfamily domain-containing protein [Xylariales sp. PMI_506]
MVEHDTPGSGDPSQRHHGLSAGLEAVAAGTPPADEATALLPKSQTALPNKRAALVIFVVCGLSFLCNCCSGIVVVALPAIQSTLDLPDNLLVWPTSSYYLTGGSCLLLAGSIADVIGNKHVNHVGSFLSALCILGCGWSRTGGEIIAFRALHGVAYAIMTPSAISIISNNIEEGRPRNMGFACMGFGQPIGFCVGLVLAGIFTDTVGWRPAFYLAAAVNFVLFLISVWVLPPNMCAPSDDSPSVWKRLAVEIDWVGVLIASLGLAILSYVLASLSADIDNARRVPNVILLMISGLSVPSFIGWTHYQEKHNRITLIPNSIWRSHVFTSCCVMVMLANALANCMELYSSLFFQQIQGISALGASLRVVPSLLAGALASLVAGLFVNRTPVMLSVLLSSTMSTIAPLLMALIPTDQLYWKNAFFAQILTPVICDVLFTVGLLIVSDIFPKHMQALSGAVFNTCGQIGGAIGLSVTQVIASSVANGSSPEELMKGYRAAFWIMFGWMLFVCLVSVIGLRRVGRIGVSWD